jgi:hypothetical protein
MAIQTAPNSEPGLLFFSDARTCKEWLKAIPLNNIAKAQQNILDALRILNRSPDFMPVERLTCMELMRDKVGFLLSEQRSRYAGKTIPLAHGDNAAWLISRTLLTEMEAGYRRCWVDAASADSPLAAHAALIIQRIMRYLGLQMLIAGFIYRRFDPALWMRLHLQWMEAESRGLEGKRVKDSIGAIDGHSTVTQAFTAVLLGQAANIYELTPRQIDFVDTVLKRFGHKVELTREGTPNPQGLQSAVDLLANAGCAFYARVDPADHVRFLKLDDLSKSLRRRIRKLADGEEPGSMELPAEWASAEAREQLVRLHKLWCEGTAMRSPATIPDDKIAQLTFGISATHFFMSGETFEQPDVWRELTRQEMNDITMFGKVSQTTIRSRNAEFDRGSEAWGIIDESRGFLRMLRPATSSQGVAIGKLVGIQSNKRDGFYLGVVRELSEELDGAIYATLAMLPGKPEATSLRSTDHHNRGGGQFVQGFRLPPMDSMKIPETLVVPASFVQRGRGIDIFHAGQGGAKLVTLQDFVERGVDFDRVTFS